LPDLRATVSRAAMIGVMAAAVALIFGAPAAVLWGATGLLCLFLALNLRYFTVGTWVPVALSLVVLIVALLRGVPAAVYMDAAGRMVFLAALIAVLHMLRIAAGVAPEVAQAGRFLTGQPASRRYLALTFGGHLFGVLINFGGLALLLDLSTRAMKDRGADDLPPELHEVRLRRMTLAVMRGFGLISLWSPLGFATNVVLITLPGVSYTDFGPLGFAMSFVFVAIGWSLDRLAGRRYRQMALPQPHPPPGSWVGAALLLGHVAFLGGLVVGLHEVSRLSFQQALIVLVPLYALGWTAWSTHRLAGGAMAGLRTAAQEAWLRQPRTAGEVGIFAAAGFLPVVLLALLPMGALQTTAAGFGLGAVPLALGISASIIAGALLGVNPIVTASVVGAVAAELAVPGLSLTAIALAIIGGWSVVIGLSPFITTIVFCAAIVGRPVWTVGPVWNGPYCAAVFGVWCVLLVVLMATGTI